MMANRDAYVDEPSNIVSQIAQGTMIGEELVLQESA